MKKKIKEKLTKTCLLPKSVQASLQTSRYAHLSTGTRASDAEGLQPRARRLKSGGLKPSRPLLISAALHEPVSPLNPYHHKVSGAAAVVVAGIFCCCCSCQDPSAQEVGRLISSSHHHPISV
ncbi:hypothetical protein NPIL_460891 [Nephila pilipes]|uniref:Uncharacterized protein n=1 Tax=Nephila pilipes TaxID=299642 RepID=A0A8X6NDG8_NEPPI|nr:hypothetical protein NPIL_460891 [Nephila pilipes]